MLDEKLKEMREEENKSISRGRKLVGSFVIINIVVTLLTWILSIYSWYIALISIAISLLIYFFNDESRTRIVTFNNLCFYHCI